MANKNYYEILGIDEAAGFDAIKKSYRKLAKENHPDTHPGDVQAEKKFKEVSEAYNVLSDSKKRQQYDQMRKYGFGAASGGGFGSQGVNIDLSEIFGNFSGGSRRRSKRKADFNLDDFFGFGGLGDLFSQVLDRENGFGTQGRPGKGQDVSVNLEIPFETAVLGGKAKFRIQKGLACESCKGTGSRVSQKPSTCAECEGSGMVSMARGAFAVNRPCPRCLGKGKTISDPCKKCGGSGQTRGSKTFSVNIKPATGNGHNLKLSGQGNPGGPGEPAGDLILTIRVGQHKFFKNKGLDIYCEVTIDKNKARQGTKIKVKTINGDSVKLTIPPNSDAGKTFRLKGMGIAKNNSQGDQYIKIKLN